MNEYDEMFEISENYWNKKFIKEENEELQKIRDTQRQQLENKANEELKKVV